MNLSVLKIKSKAHNLFTEAIFTCKWVQYLPAFCESCFTTLELVFILMKAHLMDSKKTSKIGYKTEFAISNGLIFLRGVA